MNKNMENLMLPSLGLSLGPFGLFARPTGLKHDDVSRRLAFCSSAPFRVGPSSRTLPVLVPLPLDRVVFVLFCICHHRSAPATMRQTQAKAVAGVTQVLRQTKMAKADKKKMSEKGGGLQKPSNDSKAVNIDSMTWKERYDFLVENITVEPMLACYIIPSVLASLATQNLNLEKACL
ncbi:unnamed protein product [Callosobruchus maculatus]|uniref:Uncharacterized protein n=1 Tax=Callosobruchus maculatus TaxID=64391 RepID=A0A653C207_CALMS|nr:unnamed protein product [Callosobruchus maculatus]